LCAVKGSYSRVWHWKFPGRFAPSNTKRKLQSGCTGFSSTLELRTLLCASCFISVVTRGYLDETSTRGKSLPSFLAQCTHLSFWGQTHCVLCIISTR